MLAFVLRVKRDRRGWDTTQQVELWREAPEKRPTGMSMMPMMSGSTSASRISRSRQLIHSVGQFTCTGRHSTQSQDSAFLSYLQACSCQQAVLRTALQSFHTRRKLVLPFVYASYAAADEKDTAHMHTRGDGWPCPALQDAQHTEPHDC